MPVAPPYVACGRSVVHARRASGRRPWRRTAAPSGAERRQSNLSDAPAAAQQAVQVKLNRATRAVTGVDLQVTGAAGLHAQGKMADYAAKSVEEKGEGDFDPSCLPNPGPLPAGREAAVARAVEEAHGAHPPHRHHRHHRPNLPPAPPPASPTAQAVHRRSDERDAPRSVEKTLEGASLEDSVLKAIDAALLAVGKEQEEKAKQEAASKKLPLFHPGHSYTAEEARSGFRVLDGYDVSISNMGAVCVGSQRRPDHEEGVSHAVFTNSRTGGLDWVYWDDFYKNDDGLCLAECVAQFGIGGWHNPKKDTRAKVVFLGEDRSCVAGRCFILAVDRPLAGGQVGVRGQEERESTRRVYRATSMGEAKQLEALWAAVQFKQERKQVLNFWEMPDVAP